MKKLITGFLLTISVNSFSQEPIFATIAGGDLYSFNIQTCTRNFKGSTGQGFGDIAFTPDGELWGIVSGNLYHIDTTSAYSTLIGSTGLGGASLVGLNDTTLLAEAGSKLYGINTNTAASYYIDSIGYQASGDLTWYDDDLFIVTSAGRIVKIILDSTYTSILSVTPIGSSIPTCEGAVTATFTGDYNSIVGFNGPNLIKICQIDGTFQPLCPSLNIGGTPGAASIRLSTQIPIPTSCISASVQEVSTVNELLIYPNPTNGAIRISSSIQGQLNYTIYNAFGQEMLSGISGDSSIIRLDNLSNGIYSILLTKDTNKYRQCLIIRK